MFPDLIPAEDPTRPAPPARRAATPALFSPSEHAERRFWEFFTVNQVEPMLVAAYVEQLTAARSPATVKQHLAALRMLFDWLVVGQGFRPTSDRPDTKHREKPLP